MIATGFIEKFKTKLEKDIHFRELIRGSVTFFVIRVLGILVTYMFTIIVTRNLGASAWGIFTLCLTILQITSVIGRLGLDIALLRFIAQYNAQGKGGTAKYIYLKSISLVIPFTLLLSVGLYFSAPVLAEKVFQKEQLTPYIKLIAFAILPFTLLYINSESLRAFKKIKEYATFQNLLPFLIALIIAGTFFISLNIRNAELILLAYITGVSLASLLSFLFLWKEFINTTDEKERVSVKHILSVSFPMFMSSSLFMIMSWTDTIMLGMWRSEEEVGIYNVAVRLSMITSFTLMAINSIAAPKFAELWKKKDLEGLKKVSQQSTKLIFWISFPILILYIAFPKEFMGLFGEEFRDGYLVLIFLVIGQFINVLTGPIYYIFQMTNKEVLQFVLQFIYMSLNMILNIILIPIYGKEGAAFSTMFTYVSGKLISSFFLQKNFGFWNIYIPFFRM